MIPQSEQEIEQQLKNKGKTGPRLTPALIDAQIVSEDYHVFEPTMTVCCLTLQNGFKVIGSSAAASPENFDAGIGRRIARDHARESVWQLEGYALRQRLYDIAGG